MVVASVGTQPVIYQHRSRWDCSDSRSVCGAQRVRGAATPHHSGHLTCAPAPIADAAPAPTQIPTRRANCCRTALVALAPHARAPTFVHTGRGDAVPPVHPAGQRREVRGAGPLLCVQRRAVLQRGQRRRRRVCGVRHRRAVQQVRTHVSTRRTAPACPRARRPPSAPYPPGLLHQGPPLCRGIHPPFVELTNPPTGQTANPRYFPANTPTRAHPDPPTNPPTLPWAAARCAARPPRAGTTRRRRRRASSARPCLNPSSSKPTPWPPPCGSCMHSGCSCSGPFVRAPSLSLARSLSRALSLSCALHHGRHAALPGRTCATAHAR